MISVWIGLTRDSSNPDWSQDWFWLDGRELNYEAWSYLQPNDDGNPCTVINTFFITDWLDESCTGTDRSFVCKNGKFLLTNINTIFD